MTAAETLAYLTEVDTELQRLASISNHLVPTLAELLHYQPEPSHTQSVQLTPSQTAQRLEQEVKTAQDMKQAAFRVSALKFSGFHSGDFPDCGLLACDTTYCLLKERR